MGGPVKTIGLNAFVSIHSAVLTRQFEESYRVASVAGGAVTSRLYQSTVRTSEVP